LVSLKDRQIIHYIKYLNTASGREIIKILKKIFEFKKSKEKPVITKKTNFVF
jgi:hypothetical protein